MKPSIDLRDIELLEVPRGWACILKEDKSTHPNIHRDLHIKGILHSHHVGFIQLTGVFNILP